MASVPTAPVAADTIGDTIDDVLCEVFAAGHFNRELHRLVRLLTELRDRLSAFADREVVPPLMAGLIARGFGQHESAEAIVRLLAARGGPNQAQEAAEALVYVLSIAASDLHGMTSPLP